LEEVILDRERNKALCIIAKLIDDQKL